MAMTASRISASDTRPSPSVSSTRIARAAASPSRKKLRSSREM